MRNAKLVSTRSPHGRRSRGAEAAPAKLDATIRRDLEKRGLLQFDPHERRYDLRPVVRGVAVGRMQSEETRELGRKVVDHFNNRPHDPPREQTETLADIEPGMEVVRVLLRMRLYKEAFQGLSEQSRQCLTRQSRR